MSGPGTVSRTTSAGTRNHTAPRSVSGATTSPTSSASSCGGIEEQRPLEHARAPATLWSLIDLCARYRFRHQEKTHFPTKSPLGPLQFQCDDGFVTMEVTQGGCDGHGIATEGFAREQATGTTGRKTITSA